MERSENNSMREVLSLRNFRLLFAGVGTSLLGNQFTLIATPWLVLQLTDDPLILSLVLALEGLPRALFMLVGGAFIDRFHPRLVMLITDVLCFVLTALMAVAVLSGVLQLWMVFVFALGFGLVSGFAAPATNSIIPMLVRREDLEAGNSLIMGITQLANFVGPTVAGILIGKFSSSTLGIGLAFTADTLSFGVSAILMGMITGPRVDSTKEQKNKSLWTEIFDGMRYLWQDRVLRFMFLLLTAINFLLIGPLTVGIPLLAEHRLSQGATAFGILMSSFAGGNLFGYLGAGALPRPNASQLKLLILSLIGFFGAVIAALGFINSTGLDALLLVILGLGNGYLAIQLFTWMQARTPSTMLGRTMSLLMFSNSGLVPVSQMLSGLVSKGSLTLLFAGSGALVLILTAIAAFRPELLIFSKELCSIKGNEDNGVRQASL